MKLALSLALFRFLSTLQATVLIVAGSRVVATVWARRRPPGPPRLNAPARAGAPAEVNAPAKAHRPKSALRMVERVHAVPSNKVSGAPTGPRKPHGPREAPL